MKRQVVRISVLQSSKIMTALSVVTGLFLYLIGLFRVLVGGEQIRNLGILDLFVPIDFAFTGFIVSVILSSLYNLLAKWLGGVEFEVKDMG